MQVTETKPSPLTSQKTSVILFVLFLLAAFAQGASVTSQPTAEAGGADLNYGAGAFLTEMTERPVTLFAQDGHSVRFEDLYVKVKSYLPAGSDLDEVAAYLMDLDQDGQYEVLADAKFKDQDQSMWMVLDEKGALLANRANEYYGQEENPVFGSLGKGKPICFGMLVFAAASARSCEWKFYVWLHGKIKLVLDFGGHNEAANPLTPPRFKAAGHDGNVVEVVTDDWTFKWDSRNERFVDDMGKPVILEQGEFRKKGL